MAMAGRILVGTSSWADEGFVKHWYPKGMAARDRLAWYAERFDAVELNSSFYAIPSRGNVERWAEITPDGFSFDVKLHRLLSRHATKPDALPPDMRGEVELNERGNVIATPRGAARGDQADRERGRGARGRRQARRLAAPAHPWL